MIRLILNFYIFLVFLDAILSFFPSLNRNEYRLKLKKIADYTCGPVRKRLPPTIPLDISPLIVAIAISIFIAIFDLLW